MVANAETILSQNKNFRRLCYYLLLFQEGYLKNVSSQLGLRFPNWELLSRYLTILIM